MLQLEFRCWISEEDANFTVALQSALANHIRSLWVSICHLTNDLEWKAQSRTDGQGWVAGFERFGIE